MATKTEFVYAFSIFYAVLIILTTIGGNIILNNNLNIDVPNANYNNVVKNEDSVNHCDVDIINNDLSLLEKLTPFFMRPKCVTDTAEDVTEGYVTSLLDDANKDNINSFSFIPALIVGFSFIPDWLNAVIFAPLIVAILFLLVTTIGGLIFDGGN